MTQPDVGFGVGITWDCRIGEDQVIVGKAKADLWHVGRHGTFRLISNTKSPASVLPHLLKWKLNGILVRNSHAIADLRTDVQAISSKEFSSPGRSATAAIGFS